MEYRLEFVRNNQREILREAIRKTLFSNIQLNCLCYNNAYVLPHQGKDVAGVVTQDFHFLPSTGLDGNEQRKYDGENAKIENSVAIYLGCFHWVWGHYLTDNIKRFWFLYTEEGKQLISHGAKIVFTCVCNRELTENGLKLMQMADVNPSSFQLIKVPTQFKKLYIPDPSIIHTDLSQSSLGERLYTKEYKETVSKIIDKIPDRDLHDSIYFSRTGIKDNYLREFGEWSIEKIFKKKGYRIIHPEKISLEEQLMLLHNCSHFATTEGSVAHNAIFCRPGTYVEIIRKADYVNSYQLLINTLSDLDVTYIDAHHTTPPYGDGHIWFGPFYLCVTKSLLDWAGLLPIYVPYWLHCTYWWYRLSRTNFMRKYISNRILVHNISKRFWIHCADIN